MSISRATAPVLLSSLFMRGTMALEDDRTKWHWTKWHGQNGTDKMVATFIDSNSTELNFYSVITSHK